MAKKDQVMTVAEIDAAMAAMEEEARDSIAKIKLELKDGKAGLKELRKAAVKAEREADEQLRTEAAQAIGESVLSLYEGGWKTVDFSRLSQTIAAHPELFPSRSAMSLDNARSALAQFKKASGKKPRIPSPAPPERANVPPAPSEGFGSAEVIGHAL